MASMRRGAALGLAIALGAAGLGAGAATGALGAGCSGSEAGIETAADGACGDGVCQVEGESCDLCPADCGACPACGDGLCASETGWEGCDSCPDDCGVCGSCGDGACEVESGEDCATCRDDCGVCAGCENGTCDAEAGETCASCAEDCGDCDTCGDGECDAKGGETCTNCAEDCGDCDTCGDGECDAKGGETCTKCASDCGKCEVRAGCMQGNFKPFWGNLHAHTHYSDGMATPAKAFKHARGAGLDFMWISDHREGLTPTEWKACKEQADAANESGKFIAGCGYEMTVMTADQATALGHLNTLFTGKFMDKPSGLEALYAKLATCDPCVGQWNHPPGPSTFGDYKFYPSGKSAMRLMEFNGKRPFEDKWNAYFMALNNGWTVSPSNNEDNHKENWGDSGHATGIYAGSLGRLAIRKAVQARRTFAAGDDTAEIKMMADDACWMGSILKGLGRTVISVVARDKEPGDGFGKIELYGPNKQVLASQGCKDENPCKASFPLDLKKQTFVVALATQKDGGKLVSAPIWFNP